MTSWSLTILFLHLWLSAFIALYFYSLSRKSCLTHFFSRLFGPFSCSRQVRQDQEEQRQKAAPLSQPDQNSEANRGSTTQSSKIYGVYCIENNEEETRPYILLTNPTGETTSPLLVSKSNQTEESNDCRINLSENTDKKTLECRTYCKNKDQCNLPSSHAKSDPVIWQLWIDAHVPCPILVMIKISWLLYNIVVISAIIVTVVYFSYVALFNLQVEPTWVQEIGNLHRHGINSVVAVIDILLLAYPVRIYHFVYINLYGWLYAFVTFLYWSHNPKENIVYDQIDYGQPLKIIGVYLILNIFVFLLQIIHFLAYRFKIFIKEKYLTK